MTKRKKPTGDNPLEMPFEDVIQRILWIAIRLLGSDRL